MGRPKGPKKQDLTVSLTMPVTEGLAKEYASRLGVPPDIVERQIVELAEGEAARDGKK